MNKIYTFAKRQALISAIASVMILFTGLVLNAQTNYIYIYSPYSGQQIYRNSPVDIIWYSNGADTVNLEYTLNNGTTWNGIINSLAGNNYAWTAPDTTTNQFILRISSVSDTAVFAVTGQLAITETPTLLLVSPNGGETWNYNESASISWTGTNLPYFLYMDYSVDSGLTWLQLGSVYGDSTGGTAQVSVPLVSSANARIKIYDPFYPGIIADSSDQDFTIYTPPVIVYSPYPGDEYYIKESTYISWMATGVSLVNIELSTDAGLSWQPIDTNIDAVNGFYTWTVSGTPSNSCIIKVSDATDPLKFGLSDTFTLLATPVITLNTPTGGEILNTNAPFTISWTYDNPATEYLYLEYSSNNGLDWNYIDYVLNNGIAGNYDWTTPATESEQCLIRISDYYLDFVSDTSNTFSVLSYPATPICMVTVDSTSNRNTIVWEKPVSPLIYQFIIYKESAVAGNYEMIGTTGYNDFSTFADTNSNPAIKSYRYKLGFTDAAGHIFPAGNLHQTIHLSINQGVGNSWNLIWTDYLGFNVGSYNIYRGTNPASMTLITSISASFNSYTDLNVPAGYIYYMVEVVNPNGCNPTLKSNDYSNSRSNIATNKSLGTDQHAENLNVTIYPNPVSDLLNLSITGSDGSSPKIIELRDCPGQVVYSHKSAGSEPVQHYNIKVENLPEGMYMLVVIAGKSTTVRKVIVRH